MQNSEKHVDQVFREGLENFRVIPPADIWDAVKAGIPQTREPFPWRKVAAIALILVVAGTSWFVIHREKQNPVSDKMNLVQENSIKDVPAQRKSHISSVRKPPVINETLDHSRNASISKTAGEMKPDHSAAFIKMDIKKHEQTGETQRTPSLERSNLALTAAAPSFSKIPLLKNNLRGSHFNLTSLQSLLLKQPQVQNQLSFTETETSADITKKSKWGINGNLSPVYSFRTLRSSGSTGKGMNYFYNQESAVVSYSGGVNVIYKSGKRISFRTGVQYSKGGQKLNNIIFYRNLQTGALLRTGIFNRNIPYPFKTSVGQVSSANLDPYLADFILPDGSNYTGNLASQPEFENYETINTNVSQEFEFIEIPMLVRYRIIDRKLGLNIISGLGTSLLVDNNAYIQYQGQKIPLGKSQGISTLNFTGSFGLGLDYSLGSNFSLNFEPTFKYFLNSFNTDSSPGAHPYFFGVFSGLSYYF